MTGKTETTALHPLSISRQIESLRELKQGWLDGEGKAPSLEGLHWLGEALQTRITFSDETMPRIYPTEDGGVQAEWTIGNISADLNIDLDSHQATWGWSNLSSKDYSEKTLDLNKESDWQWLNQALRKIQADSRSSPAITDKASRLKEELEQAGPEWDGPGSINPEPVLIDQAAAWIAENWRPSIEMPEICPTANGGVSFSWIHEGIEHSLDVEPDGASVEWCRYNPATMQSVEKQLIMDKQGWNVIQAGLEQPQE